MSRVLIGDRYEVLSDQPLAEFDTTLAKAFAARDLRQPDNALIVLKTSVFPPPRHQDFDAFISIGRQSSQLKMMQLQHVANTAWSGGEDNKSMALVYERPNGKPIVSSLTETFTPWTDNQVIQLILLPLYEILSTLQQSEVVHRAIRPTNLFLDTRGKITSVSLGECLSCPYGYDQSVLFEPLSYALADPIGRGESTISNDLFALGVTIIYLLNGGPPHQRSDEELLKLRLDYGSAAAYITKALMGSKLVEVLKGLLADSEDQRWTLKELNAWINAGRHSAILAQPPRRANRPVPFNGSEEIYTPQLLAQEMRLNPLSAMDLIGKNDLTTWLKNSLKDNTRVHLIEDLKAVTPHNAANAERLMGVLKIMDPESPFFWQGRSMSETGIGLYLAQAIHNNDRVDSMTQLILSPILSYYLSDTQVAGKPEEQTETGVSVDNMLNRIKTARSFLDYSGLGGGIEQCCYLLHSNLPCLSSTIRSYNCMSVPDVLNALNHMGTKPHRPDLPLDRQIVAFIIAHEKTIAQRLLLEIEKKSRQANIIGMFKLLAELQLRYRIRQLPGLCRWFGELSGTIIDSYKNIKWRENMKIKLKEITADGNLAAMIRLLDNKKAADIDRGGFRAALAEVQYLENGVKKTIMSLSTSIHYSERIGQNNAMLMSSILSFFIISGYFIIKVIL